jgi:hypothetical protein
MPTLEWTEAQNGIVRDLIAEEVEKARLSHKFIPEVKVEDKATSVRADELVGNTVDDVTTIPLVEVALPVTLTKEQAEDIDLSAGRCCVVGLLGSVGRGLPTGGLRQTTSSRALKTARSRCCVGAWVAIS